MVRIWAGPKCFTNDCALPVVTVVLPTVLEETKRLDSIGPARTEAPRWVGKDNGKDCSWSTFMAWCSDGCFEIDNLDIPLFRSCWNDDVVLQELTDDCEQVPWWDDIDSRDECLGLPMLPLEEWRLTIAHSSPDGSTFCRLSGWDFTSATPGKMCFWLFTLCLIWAIRVSACAR